MTAKDSLISRLRERGLIAQISHEEELEQLLNKGNKNEKGLTHAAYCGFDPTAASLHVGNLAALMMLRRAQNAGLQPIVLFGGATGLIGDPTGRTDMRPMNSKEQIAHYVENFKTLVNQYFDLNASNAPIFVNNIDWIGPMSWIDFSRNVGCHFTVARLLSAEVNKTRFQEGGLTFMELGYQLLQSYDFLHLFQKYNCIIQFGGDDQWSNVLGGADLIRRVESGKAFAVTTPLLIGSDGKKFGKTAGNAIWLDAKMTSPYDFFQFFRNVHDADVAKMLKVFTLIELDEIEKIFENPNINEVKEFMAFEITRIVHGEAEANKALETSKTLFTGKSGDLSNAPTTEVSKSELEAGLDILALLVKCKLSTSRGEARKLVQGNGLYLNGEKFINFSHKILESDFQTEQNTLVLRKGKKDYHLVKLV
ncbi:tyrosine--tRNA ligase [Fluviispira multicolorata]|uniref:Tyrosine--tRNA ligase n=1 Tax=Fluviispira multicolorata TaxID=2654512 RepID=A0A833JBJ8_9BACT|nr:tyrosine--tRNA ligase [Fluviispira multicolorata]KAB8028100.1 tyrosine--tRNA ligase [Fluviispira multicolorata]